MNRKSVEGFLRDVFPFTFITLIFWLVVNFVFYAFHIDAVLTFPQIIASLSLIFLLYAVFLFFKNSNKIVGNLDIDKALKASNLLIIALIAKSGNDGEAYVDLRELHKMEQEGVSFKSIDCTDPYKAGFLLVDKNGKRYLGGK